jgi:TonB-dependent starch-binding outer membrane protein SusC
MWINDGEISNKGFEFTVDGDIISTKDWKLSGTFIFSTNKNKVLSLGNSQSAGLQTDPLTGMQYEYYGTTLDPFRQTSPNILAIGQAVNVIYGYKTNGIVQTKAQGLASGMTGYEAEPGEFNFVDLSGDGVWNENDRTVIGDPNPDFIASLNLNLRYKNFDAGVFLNGVYGNDVIETDLYNSAQFTPLRWTADNPTNSYPRLRDNRLYYVSDWFIRDGSYLRIQNVNIGYTFTKPKFIQNSRIYLNVDNLYTFTKFRGYDPEVGLNGRYSGGYPRFRKITIGVELNF